MIKPLTHSPSPQSSSLLPLPAALIIILLSVSMHIGEASNNTHDKHQMARHSNFLRSRYGSYGRRSETVLSCAHNASVCGGLMAQKDVDGAPWGACCWGKVCKDIREDPYHCGGCGRACGYGLSCCDGACVDLNMDSRNCGRCGSHCPLQEKCSFGMCDYAGVTISPTAPTWGPKHR
eukprot:c40610_g1_i1 orf=665-1195(-)